MSRDLSVYLQQVVFEVDEEGGGLRLDHFLVDRVFWRSRTDLQARIKRGAVLLNDRQTKASARLAEGDAVTVIVSPEDLPDQDPSKIALEILREDDHVVALNKQPGVIVHPTGRHVYDTLMNALWLRYRSTGEADRGVKPEVVHRLDRDTSGVIVFAKTPEAKKVLQDAFEARRPEKTYLALAEGVIAEDRFDVGEPLGPDENARIRIKICVRPDGAPSRTTFEVIQRFANHTLVRCRLHTGRQHQIRVHLAHVGHPIVADPLYGNPCGVGRDDADEPIVDRQVFHAATLSLTHPITDDPMFLEAPLPADMQSLVDHLAAGGSWRHTADNQSSRWA